MPDLDNVRRLILSMKAIHLSSTDFSAGITICILVAYRIYSVTSRIHALHVSCIYYMSKIQTYIYIYSWFNVKHGGMRIRANLHSCQVNHRIQKSRSIARFVVGASAIHLTNNMHQVSFTPSVLLIQRVRKKKIELSMSADSGQGHKSVRHRAINLRVIWYYYAIFTWA